MGIKNTPRFVQFSAGLSSSWLASRLAGRASELPPICGSSLHHRSPAENPQTRHPSKPGYQRNGYSLLLVIITTSPQELVENPPLFLQLQHPDAEAGKEDARRLP